MLTSRFACATDIFSMWQLSMDTRVKPAYDE